MSSKTLPKVQMRFGFLGESFDPDEITERLGIQPTVMYRPGDPITQDGRGRRQSYGWAIKVGPRHALEIDALLQELREQVNLESDQVRELCRDLGIEASILCGVGMGEADDLPVTFFPQDFVAWAAEMGAAINVDIVL
jgi:Domain of unknown function (DUF4279)